MKSIRAAALIVSTVLAVPFAATGQEAPPPQDTLRGFFDTFLDALANPRPPEGAEPPVSASYSLKDLMGRPDPADEPEEPMVPGPGASDPPPESEPPQPPPAAEAPPPSAGPDRPVATVLPPPTRMIDCPGAGRAAATATLDQAHRLAGCAR